jgi:hypothetical protein
MLEAAHPGDLASAVREVEIETTNIRKSQSGHKVIDHGCCARAHARSGEQML